MDEERKAKEREEHRRRRAVRRAQGRCQNCGVSCAEGSVSRCAGCLEKARRGQRGRDGTTGVRPKRRGRPMLGEWRIRNRAWEHDEQLRERDEQRRQRDRLRARRWRWGFGE